MKKIIFLILSAFLANLLLADGLIVIPQPPQTRPQSFHPFPLEVVYHHVAVDIDGKAATTHIDQAFYNPTNSRLEGYYIFPIPQGAVLKDFNMYINGRETPAELLDAEKAKKIYEDIVRQMRDPALLEYTESGMFKVRIYPIEPHSEKKVTMSYREILNEDNGTMEYLYPLNTEKFSSKPLQDVSIEVEIKSTGKLKNIYCPTQNVDIIRHDEYNAVVSYEESQIKPDTDFKLYFDTGSDKFGLSLVTYKQPGEDGYYFLNATPAMKFDESEINEKDITFVLDVSGSMADRKLKQAKQALIYCIENLNKGDRFEVIRFSTEAYALFEQLTPVTRDNMNKAEDFIRNLNPVGGTNIEEALTMAIQPESSSDRPHMVIFLTDGKPTIGEKDEDKLLAKIKKANKHNIRIFTFGIGNEINTHLLDKITELTRATRSYITPEEDIELKISSFYDKVQSPVLTDVFIRYTDPIKTYQEYPQPLPDIFKGSSLTILGRYKDHGKSTITISGKLKGKDQQFEFPVYFSNNSQKNDFIPPLWAARRIGHLLDLIRLHGESDELVDEITLLAREHGIVTPYTSYLIVEDEEKRVAADEFEQEFQTLGGAGSFAPELSARTEREFQGIARKTGSRSVQVSKEFNALNNALNIDQTRQGKDRMAYKDISGEKRNLTQQVKNIQGRAVYQTGKFWIDSYLQNQENKKAKQIKFASNEYFQLLKDHPESAQFLALGQNVRFLMKGVYYEVIE